MTLPTGSRLGPYEILNPIGAGGMGEVYRARDSKLGRDVAIKVLPETFAGDPDRMGRFGREAKLLAALDHSNIASIYGLEESGSTHALVMQLAEGPTLADRIAQGPIPIEDALKISKQIAEGLEYAHEKGIIHRDLKPANVKVAGDDTVKILDFGLAKALESGPSATDIANSPTLSHMATQAGVLLGTAAYMSPEQAKGKSVDRRADIWAFGCVLYEMLTGKKVFAGDTVPETLGAIMRAEPDWSRLPTATPMRVRVLLQRCLQKDPKQRLQAIGDARISLEEVLTGALEATPGLAPAARSRWPLIVSGFACVATLTTALFAFLYFHQLQPRSEITRFEIPMPHGVVAQTGGHFAVSPDGRQLAFFGTEADGVTRLWVRPLDSLQARPLSGSETLLDLPIFWSPDSRYIAFYDGGKLKKIAVAGGPAETICDVNGVVVGGSWNRDGVIIFGLATGPIMRVSSAGGTAIPLTVLDSSRKEADNTRPAFLPDGRHFVYTRWSSSPEYRGAYIGSLDVKPEAQSLRPLLVTSQGVEYVPSPSKGSGYMFFMRDKALFAQAFDPNRMKLTGEAIEIADHVGSYQGRGYFAASGNGVLAYRTGSTSTLNSQLTWLDREGKVQGAPVMQPGVVGDIAISPNAQRVALTLTAPTALWLHDFQRGTTTRFTFGSAPATRAIWSPDGKTLIFASARGGGQNLYEKPANGSRPEQLVLKSTSATPTSWSHDGRFVLYTQHDPATDDDVWVLPLKDGGKPFPLLRTDANETFAQFSPDGHWVAYTSDESGREEIYVRSFSPDATGATASPGAKWQISTGGGRQPRWRGDGKELYYITANNRIMAVAIGTAPSLSAGVPKLLFQVPPAPLPAPYFRRWDVTSDGNRFLFITPAVASEQAPFTVVLDWQDALKK